VNQKAQRAAKKWNIRLKMRKNFCGEVKGALRAVKVKARTTQYAMRVFASLRLRRNVLHR